MTVYNVEVCAKQSILFMRIIRCTDQLYFRQPVAKPGRTASGRNFKAERDDMLSNTSIYLPRDSKQVNNLRQQVASRSSVARYSIAIKSAPRSCHEIITGLVQSAKIRSNADSPHVYVVSTLPP